MLVVTSPKYFCASPRARMKHVRICVEYIHTYIHIYEIYIYIYTLFYNYAYGVCTLSPTSLFSLSSHAAFSECYFLWVVSFTFTCYRLLYISKVLCCFQPGLHFYSGFIIFLYCLSAVYQLIF